MKAKRFFSVLLAVMLVMSCFAISASADALVKPDSGNLHIIVSEGTGTTPGDGTEQSTITGNVSGVRFQLCKVDDNETSTSDAGKTFSNDNVTNASGEVIISNLAAGRYLVKVASKPDSVGNIDNFLVDVPMTDPTNLNAWLTDVYVYPKVTQGFDEPVITKAVKDSVMTESVPAADGISIAGTEEATWTVEVTVPHYIDRYITFVVSDTVDDRLTVVDNSLTNSKEAALTGTSNGFTNQTLTLNFDPKKLTAGEKITITYKTKIASASVGTVSGGTLIPNQATVTYTNNPTASHTGTSGTKESNEPKVYTGKLEVTKKGNDAGNPVLSDVDFTLTGATTGGPNPVYSATVATTNASGVATWTGLKDGSYTLQETKAHSGYELNPTVFNVTVANGVATVTGVDNNTIVNIKKVDLPLTGGMGVTLFAVCGLALAAAGAFLLKSKRYE